MGKYVKLINHQFFISELVVKLSSVLKELNCFVQLSLPLLQSMLDSQEPQSVPLQEVIEVFLSFLYTRICYSLSRLLIYSDDLCVQVHLTSLKRGYLVLGLPCIHLLSSINIQLGGNALYYDSYFLMLVHIVVILSVRRYNPIMVKHFEVNGRLISIR